MNSYIPALISKILGYICKFICNRSYSVTRSLGGLWNLCSTLSAGDLHFTAFGLPFWDKTTNSWRFMRNWGRPERATRMESNTRSKYSWLMGNMDLGRRRTIWSRARRILEPLMLVKISTSHQHFASSWRKITTYFYIYLRCSERGWTSSGGKDFSTSSQKPPLGTYAEIYSVASLWRFWENPLTRA